jgi:protein TonB
MSQGGFFERQPLNTRTLAVVLLLHGAALTALALSRTEVIRDYVPNTTVTFIPNPPEPAPEAEARPRQKTEPSVIRQVTPAVQTKRDPVVTTRPLDEVILPDPGPIAAEPKAAADPLPPLPAPVRIAARIDPRSTLQPAYPPSEQRAGNEGSVTVRLLVGADGRVKKVTRISAASDAFFRATERQALTYWRFRPATLDGRPVESQTVMTVHFRLDA